jgi:hypothetical protein
VRIADWRSEKITATGEETYQNKKSKTAFKEKTCTKNLCSLDNPHSSMGVKFSLVFTKGNEGNKEEENIIKKGDCLCSRAIPVF